MDKYFILDKQYAKEGVSRCIGIFKNEPTQQDIEQCISQYGAEETIVYVGEDIPHYFTYIEQTNSIKEIKKETQPEIIQPNTTTVEEKIFDDKLLEKENEYYFYITKSIAEKDGISCVRAATKQKILNTEKYFGDTDVIMSVGDNVSYYVTVDGETFREATKIERYKRGQYKLEKYEYFDGNDIKILKEGEYYDGEQVVSVKEPDIPINKYWDFEKRKWVFSETELQAINRIEEELIECMNEIKTRKEIGLGFEVAEKKYKRLLEDHKIVSEIYATKKNEKI